MKVIDDDDDFFSSTLIDEIALMLPCCQKLLPWISVTGPRHSGSRLYEAHYEKQTKEIGRNLELYSKDR